MEDICKKNLQERLGRQFKIHDSSNYIDEELRVDLEVSKSGAKVAGIQVKPQSFDSMRSEVRIFNQTANDKYDHPVLYARYNYNSEEFTNLKTVAEELRAL
jgi:hypothetical protein